jgi:N-methylhydantoinase B
MMLAYDIPWNYGLWGVINWVLPEASVVNPTDDAPVSVNTPAGVGYVTIGTVADCISQLYLCSKKKQEAFGNGSNAFNNPTLYGKGKRGEFFLTMMMENMISGAGALIHRDGDDTCSNMWTTKPQVTNMERAEELFPWLYLWRKEAMDTGGPGKFRGGVGCCNCFIPWGTKGMGVHDQGLGMESRLANGLIGGYPAAHVKQYIVRNSNTLEMLQNGRMPKSPNEIKGQIEIRLINDSFDLNASDTYVVYYGGGGGCGDPLERKPEAVAQDVRNEYVSLIEAERTYGVIIGSNGQVESERTDARRQEMIAERLSVGKV